MTWDRYIGLPWEAGGRTWQGVDCWGLLCLWMWSERGVHLPHFSADQQVDIAGEAEEGAWQPVSEPVEGDAAVYRRAGTQNLHVGLIAPQGRILHIEEDQTSVLIHGHPRLSRLIGHYRKL